MAVMYARAAVAVGRAGHYEHEFFFGNFRWPGVRHLATCDGSQTIPNIAPPLTQRRNGGGGRLISRASLSPKSSEVRICWPGPKQRLAGTLTTPLGGARSTQ